MPASSPQLDEVLVAGIEKVVLLLDLPVVPRGSESALVGLFDQTDASSVGASD
jgi:hypothetical protein